MLLQIFSINVTFQSILHYSQVLVCILKNFLSSKMRFSCAAQNWKLLKCENTKSYRKVKRKMQNSKNLTNNVSSCLKMSHLNIIYSLIEILLLFITLLCSIRTKYGFIRTTFVFPLLPLIWNISQKLSVQGLNFC